MKQKHSEKTRTIVLTGGHAGTTALATIEAIQELYPHWIIKWVGPKYAFEGATVQTLEFKTFPQLGVECVPIVSGRLQRKFSRYTIQSLFRIPRGFMDAYKILVKLEPDAILSFGGYAAFPLVVIGWLLRVPIIVHEQTIAIGRANKFSSFFAKRIAISWKESGMYFPKKKTVLTGNPVLNSIRALPIKKHPSAEPVLYVTGGSRGSQTVNAAVIEALPKLIKTFQVIHQTGDLDYEKCVAFRGTLETKLQKHYEVVSFIDPLKVSEIYKRADIVIGRSGANTVSEVLIVRRPAIFIPIPWTQQNEQVKNAQAAKEAGVAEVLDQIDLNGELLTSLVMSVYKNYSRYVSDGESKKYVDRSASYNLANLVNSYLK